MYFLKNDTPNKCLNRMVKYLLRDDDLSVREEVQYFWRQKWAIKDIKKPRRTDDLTLALKACIVERMVEVWNAPPKNQNESVPEWCCGVPALDQEFSVISKEYRHFFEDDPSDIFGKRNIFAPRNYLFFV